LLEATAFGTRTIIETFNVAGVPVREFVAAGGVLKNRLLMQIYADVLKMPAGAYPDVPPPLRGACAAASIDLSPGTARRTTNCSPRPPGCTALLHSVIATVRRDCRPTRHTVGTAALPTTIPRQAG
jgi:hypothetical protein